MIYCYVDESIHDSCGFVATAFVFAEENFEKTVEEVLLEAGLSPPSEEFKSSARMDSDSKMKLARDGLLDLAGKARVAEFLVHLTEQRLVKILFRPFSLWLFAMVSIRQRCRCIVMKKFFLR